MITKGEDLSLAEAVAIETTVVVIEMIAVETDAVVAIAEAEEDNSRALRNSRLKN